MSFKLSVHSNIKDVKQQLSWVEKKQLPAATQWALNNTARKVKLAEQREMKRVLNSPKPFTTNAFWIKWAKKNNLEAIVKIKDQVSKGNAAATYLSPVIAGKARKHKGFERLLMARGQMPKGMYAVPSRTIKKDRYGNVSTGMIQKILSGLGAQRKTRLNPLVGSKRSRKGRSTLGKYFSGIIGNVHGIWDVKRLHEGGPALLFIFVRAAPKYSKQFDFEKVAKKISKAVFKREFDKSLRKALATAR